MPRELAEKVLKCKTKKFFNFIFLYEKFPLYSYKKINEAEHARTAITILFKQRT
jgi:hypothetical protein